MSTTLTVRLEDKQRQALEKRAVALGKSMSEVVRDILERALAEEPISARAGHLRGRLTLTKPERVRFESVSRPTIGAVNENLALGYRPSRCLS